MIAAVMLMSVALVGILCVVAYTLATYALPLMLGFAAARFAYHTGSGLIGATFIGLIAATAAFAVFSVLLATLRSPILRLIVALIFAAPAGYALVHGATHEAIPSAIWRQIFCFIGGRSSASRRCCGWPAPKQQQLREKDRLRLVVPVGLMTLLPKDDAECARYALAKFEGRLESLDVEPVAPQWALPFGPRFRLRRNHACGVFPPFGFNR